jgi:excisionase family DNA binding protein
MSVSSGFIKDLISQAEAARLRGCSRQAIQLLVRNGRLQTFEIGGRLLVSKKEVLGYEIRPPGRPLGSKDKKKRRPKTKRSSKRRS